MTADVFGRTDQRSTQALPKETFMKSRVRLTVVLAASMWTSSAAQPQKERCGTRQPGVEEVAELELRNVE